MSKKVLFFLNKDKLPIYLLRDEFTTNASAPLTSPRTCEPGPGALTIVDANNKFSISGGRMVIATGTSASLTDYAYLTVMNRIAGAAFLLEATFLSTANGTNMTFGIDNNTTATILDRFLIGYSGANQAYLSANGSTPFLVATLAATTSYKLAFVTMTAGFKLFIKGGTFTEWTRLYVSNLGSANFYPAVNPRDPSGTASFDFWRCEQLSAPFNTDYGDATARVASPAVGETITGEANAVIEMIWTAATGQVWEFSVRHTDDNNRWIVRCDQAGSTIKLIERNAGTETERSSAAQTWTNSTTYRLVVIQTGNTINVFIANVVKNTYASAAFNSTATGVKTDRAGSNLIAWPRVLSGAALAEINRWTK